MTSGRVTAEIRSRRGLPSRRRRAGLLAAAACSFVLHGVALALSSVWSPAVVEVIADDGLVFVAVNEAATEAPAAAARTAAGGVRPRPLARKRRTHPTAVRGGGRDRARDPRPLEEEQRALALALTVGAVAPPPRRPEVIASPAPPRSEPPGAGLPGPAGGAGGPDGPTLLSPEAAAALRIHEDFPSLPAYLRSRTSLVVVLLQVCVSTGGVARAEGFAPRVDRQVKQIVQEAIATWRYRPHYSEGRPRSFCHRLSLQYHNQ